MKCLSSALAALSLGALSSSAKDSNAVEGPKSPAEELATFTVPAGFVVELVASEANGLINPIDLTFDDAGRLWTQTAVMYPLDAVGDMPWNDLMNLMENPALKANYPEFERIRKYYTLETPGDDKILILDNPTADSAGDFRVFADGLTIPQSILPYKSGAFIAHGSEMLYLDDSDGDGKSDAHKTILTGFGFNDTHTMSHSLVRGPGGWVHFSQGALNEGLVKAVASGESTEINYSKIAKFSLDGRKIEVTNSAANNMWGFQLRETGQWYASEANDRGYCVTPLDPFMAVPGIGNKNQRDYQPWTPRIHNFGVGGTGLSGLAFDENGTRGFPDEWNNVAFLANPLTNAINAVFIERAADGSVTSTHLPNFLTTTDKWFRPVNLEFGPDGCLYVADWYNQIIAHNEVPRSDPRRDRGHGRIWRIRHESQVPSSIPNLTSVPNSALVSHLSAEILWEKRAAWQQITDREAKELIPEITSLLRDPNAAISTRVHALWSLEGLKHFDPTLFTSLLSDPQYEIRTEALRALASYELPTEQIASLVALLVQDPHHMVRAQLLRTLDDIKKTNPQLISLLIAASKPELEGDKLGGPFERRFERFLARKAMERYPVELAAFFDSPELNSHPLPNRLWALLSLPAEAKEPQFLKLWASMDKTKIDDETFVAIMGMIDNPAVRAAVSPHFLAEANMPDFLERTNRLISKLKQPQKNLHRYAVDVPLVFPDALIEMLSAQIVEGYDSGIPTARAQAMEIALNFRSLSLNDRIRRDLLEQGAKDQTFLQTGLRLLSRAPDQHGDFLAEVAANPNLDLSVRLKGLTSIHGKGNVDQARVGALIKEFFHNVEKDELEKRCAMLSRSADGLRILVRLYQEGVIDASPFDRTSAAILGRLIQDSPHVEEIRKKVGQRHAEHRKAMQVKVKETGEAVKALTGDATTGGAVFSACLACHQVGGKGLEIAPALDGSSTRDFESLMMAIVDPDAAIETGYYQHCVVTIDGDIHLGYMVEQSALGTKVASMGGLTTFTAKSDIQLDFPVVGQSFMPPSFGELPPQTIADLVAYIQTLK